MAFLLTFRPKSAYIIMKKFLLFGLVLLSLDLAAQLQISGSYGYRVGGEVDVYYGGDLGYIKIADSESFSVDLDYQLRDGFSVSLQWFAQDTRMDFHGFNSFDLEHLGGAWNNYFLVNGVYEKEINQIVPFGGIGLGIATASFDDPRYDTSVHFAAALQGGLKIFFTERLGIKLKAAMLMPLQYGSGGLYCGTGSGCSVGAGASTTIIQGDFSGGVVVKLGETNSKPHTSYSSSPTW